MLNERGVIELLAREYIAEHGGSINLSPLWVMATGTQSLLPPSPTRLNANSITTFPPRVPCTDDPWLWLGITMMNFSLTSTVVFSFDANREIGLRFTLQRTSYRPGNLDLSSATGTEYGAGWIPGDLLSARAGRRFMWDWPILLEPTDSILVEICNQGSLAAAMYPFCLYGYRFERGPA